MTALKKKLVSILLIVLMVFASGCGGGAAVEGIDELLSLGQKYLLEENYEEAIVAFEKAIQIDEKCVEAYLGMADAYIGLSDIDSAKKILQKGYDAIEDDRLKEKLDGLETPISTHQTNQTDFRKYSYANLRYSFEWERDWGSNQDALGGCWIDFQLTGDLTDVADVLIAYGAPNDSWTPATIQEQADFITRIWKDAGLVGNRGQFDGNVSEGFPIGNDDLGVFGEVLCLAVNQNYDAVGYVLIPVTIPNKAD